MLGAGIHSRYVNRCSRHGACRNQQNRSDIYMYAEKINKRRSHGSSRHGKNHNLGRTFINKPDGYCHCRGQPKQPRRRIRYIADYRTALHWITWIIAIGVEYKNRVAPPPSAVDMRLYDPSRPLRPLSKMQPEAMKRYPRPDSSADRRGRRLAQVRSEARLRAEG